MNNLISRFITDDALFQQYIQRLPAMGPSTPCEGQCKIDTICEIANVLPSQQMDCQQRLTKFMARS